MSYNRGAQSGGGSGRETCRFYLQGRCKFGDNCKNEHPRDNNRFGALQNGGNQDQSRSGDRNRSGDQYPAYGLSKEGIRADLTTGGDSGDRPIWPLSSYGPGKNAPRQLIEGECEQSMEEVRLQYYIAQASGNPADLQSYEQNERAAAEKVNQLAQQILNDLDGALKFMSDGENVHPNRMDQVTKDPGPWQKPSFSNSENSAFGQPSASPFAGAQTNNQAAKPSPFGAQPSVFGRPSFGAPSAPGPAASPFGSNTAAQAPTNASPFGAARPAFGQPSQPAFGAPSSFGAAANSQSSPFAAAHNKAPTPAFGAPSNLGVNPASPFGSTAQSGQSPSPFAATSNPAPQGNPFGSGGNTGQSANTNPFGASSAPASQSAFGAPSRPAFGAPSQPGGGSFGSQPSANPFAQNTSSQPASGFGAPSQSSGGFASTSQQSNGFGSARQPNMSSATPMNGSENLQSWKGHQVNYITPEGGVAYPVYRNPNNNNKPERIWHPNGRPATENLDAEGLPQSYEGDIGQILKQVYDYVRETGGFKEGIMPEVPPKREWVNFEV
ncbi:Hypothetical protein R9X50_00717300 [Acrodontium crateriforme]|uniref:C3H1-type domain-containing protein n=1 Tax=Acrodontium crateriforme TaxID=150365 RepID=A0AAQ3MAD2_9PEZI|nr:Hypothetical protein R9X50_00717300 [Acrodontium crateriforme]